MIVHIHHWLVNDHIIFVFLFLVCHPLSNHGLRSPRINFIQFSLNVFFYLAYLSLDLLFFVRS